MHTKFIILSTGTPNYAPAYAQQSSAIVVNHQPYFIDCGDGFMPRVLQARDQKGVSAFAIDKLNRLFLTHLHPDHTSGLTGLLVNAWVLERATPLHIFGPKGTQQLVDGILAAYRSGIDLHQNSKAPLPYPLTVVVHEYTAGEIYADQHVKVEAFNVTHGAIESYGFRFTTADKVIVHSGDTIKHQSIVDYAKNCDILIHEVYMAESLKVHSAEWQTYHRAHHTSGIELAEIANEVRPKLLILNHQLHWGHFTAQDMLDEIQARYDGPIVYGRDLDIFE